MKRIAIAALALSGCMQGEIYSGGTPETATTEELCKVIHWRNNGFDYGSAEAFAQLRARGEFTTRELDGILYSLPRVGDSERSALCGQGFFYDDVNTTSTAHGSSKQYVFRDRGIYVYTRGGKVVGVQS